MKNSKLRIPPHSSEAEESVLGAILLRNDVMSKICDILNPTDFYVDAHCRIYEAMCFLFRSGQAIDAVTLGDRLKVFGDLDLVGGAMKIASLTDKVATVQNVGHYAKIIKDAASIRKVIYTAQEIIAKGFSGELDAAEYCDTAEKAIFEATNKKHESTYVHISEPLKKAFGEFRSSLNNKETLSGITSGFSALDHKTGGFQNSDLIILAGRPAMGKTAIATNIMVNAVKKTNLPVLFFSLEMGKGQIVRRILAAECKIQTHMLRSNFLPQENWTSVITATNFLIPKPIYIDDNSPLNPMQVRSRARRLKSEAGLGMIVIDYLQLMHAEFRSKKNREQEVSEIARSLKLLARELDIPVIALSQLNRGLESRPNKRPILSDLRESGAIEQDADLVLFVYRDEVYNPESEDRGIAEIIIAKHRSGPIGTVNTRFFPQFTCFENLAEDGYPEQNGY